jgi:hypothetical protein
MSAEPMIQCENQTRRFGLFTAADHVSFSAAKASVFGCLGRTALASPQSFAGCAACANRAKVGLPMGLIPSKLFALGFKQKIA